MHPIHRPAAAAAAARACAIAAAVLAGAAAPTAHAQATVPEPEHVPAPLTFGVSQALTHESNLYRGPRGTQDDWLSTTGLALKLDQPFGPGRWRGQAALRAQRYAEEHALDSDDHAAALALEFPATSPLSGAVGVHSSRQRHRDEMDTEHWRFTRPIETQQGAYAQAQWNGPADWALWGGADSLDHTGVGPSGNNRMAQYSAEAGVAWQPHAATQGSFMLRHTRIDRPLLVTGGGGDVGRREAEFGLRWQPSDAGSLQARIAHVQEHRVGHVDRSLVTGGVAWDGSPTDRLRLRAAAFRDLEGLSGDQDPFGGEVRFVRRGDLLRDGLRLGAEWAATPAVRVVASTRLSVREIDPPQQDGGDDTPRDRTLAVSIGVRYSPWRSLDLGCAVTHEKRDANRMAQMLYMGSASFEATLAGCQVAWWYR